MTVTEFGYTTLKSGVERDAAKLDTSTSKAISERLEGVLEQPGAISAHYATSIEHPEQLWWFVDWDNVESHSQSKATVDDSFKALLDLSALGKFKPVHISPSASSPFDDPRNPAVEILLLAFPAVLSPSSKTAIEKRWEEFAEKALRAPGMVGKIATEWTVESNVPLPGEEDKHRGSMFACVISWPSVGKHEENRETQAFQDNVRLLLEMPEMIKFQVFHLHCVSKYAKDKAKD